MHCNVRPSDATPVLTRSNYDPMRSLKSLNLFPLPYYSLWYITLRCDLDLWPWTFAAYRLWHDETLYQIWFERNRAIGGGVIAISVFDLNLEHCVTCCVRSGIIFIKFDLRLLCLNDSVFMLIRYVMLWPWPLTRCSGVTRVGAATDGCHPIFSWKNLTTFLVMTFF